jgi:formylglycine-generating enzyme required for sulfatase activity
MARSQFAKLGAVVRLFALALFVPCLGCNAIFGVEGGHVDTGEIHIQGAPFSFSIEVDQGDGTTLVHSNRVQSSLSHAFVLDEDEVTVARFTAWLHAKQKVPDDGTSLDPGGPYETKMRWSSRFDVDAQGTNFSVSTCEEPNPYSHGKVTFDLDEGDYPMTCVKWVQAVAFCAFEGKRLPTNAEWQFAAQGGGDGSAAPFQAAGAPTCEEAIVDADGGECGFPVAVGTAKGKTKDGVLDMGGSVAEWTWDANDYDHKTPLPATLPDDYAGEGDAALNHLLRGGEYFTPPNLAKIQNGHAFAGDASAVSDVGFRCARTILPAD